MADRLDWAMSVTPIRGDTLEGQTIEAIESGFGRSLGGGDSSAVWGPAGVGGEVAAWTAGVHDHKESRAGNSQNQITPGSAPIDGIWIKHTGYKFDDSKTGDIDWDTPETTTVVNIANGNGAICSLKSKQCVFLPNPASSTITFTDDAGGQAVRP